MFYFFIIDSFLNISLQPSQSTVGLKQDVICSVYLPPDIVLDTIVIAWLHEEDIITENNRVTIDTSNDYFNDSIPVTVIQFDPLSEEDEGEYICYAIINGSFIYESIHLQNFSSK